METLNSGYSRLEVSYYYPSGMAMHGNLSNEFELDARHLLCNILYVLRKNNNIFSFIVNEELAHEL